MLFNDARVSHNAQWDNIRIPLIIPSLYVKKESLFGNILTCHQWNSKEDVDYNQNHSFHVEPQSFDLWNPKEVIMECYHAFRSSFWMIDIPLS